MRYIVAVLVAILSIGFAAPAQASTIEVDKAIDRTVMTDMPGWVKTKVKYRDHGYLGNTVLRVCVKAKKYMANYAHPVNLRVGDRWSGNTYQFTMGRYGNLRDGTWTCKRTSDRQRQWRVDDAYSVKGWVYGGWPDWLWPGVWRTSSRL